MLMLMLLAWFPWLLLGGGVLFLGFRAVRALELRRTSDSEIATLTARLEGLEDALAAQGEEVRRLAEGQEFTQRLLAERATTPGSTSVDGPGS